MTREFYFFNSRLTERLNRIRRRPLTVVSAHRASGKATAVRAYLSNVQGRKLWHAITTPSFADWLASFLSILASELPGAEDEAALRQTIEAAVDPADAVAALLRRRMPEEPLFYVLEMCEETNEEILRFLYRLAAQSIRNLVLIVLIQTPDPCGFYRDTDSRVNLINEEHLRFDQDDIRESFREKKLPLSAEDAALIFAETNGWAPLVASLFHEIDRRGKLQTWESLPHHLALWEEKLGEPEEIGYGALLRRAMVEMSPLEAFSLREAEAVHAALGKADAESESLRRALSPGRLPPFLYYDRESGLYHLHSVMRAQFHRAFEALPEDEKAAIRTAHEALRTKEPDCTEALRAIGEALFAMEYDAARKQIQALSCTKTALRAGDECRLQVTEAWQGAMCGRAQSAVKELETQIAARFAAGQFAEGELLILGGVLLKLVLGGEYLPDTELFEVWAPKRTERVPDNLRYMLHILRGMRLFRAGEMQRLEIQMDAADFGDRRAETMRLLLRAVARDALDETEGAKQDVAEALALAIPDRCRLPFVVLYGQLFRLFPEDGEQEAAFLEEIRERVNRHRGSMHRNYAKKQDAYGAELTRRQMEATVLAADGLTNKEIAQRMNVSENTVKTMLRLAFRKLNVEKRSDLRVRRPEL